MKVTDQRTRKDFADCIRELVDVHYPDAEKIVLSERFILEKYEPTDWELLPRSKRRCRENNNQCLHKFGAYTKSAWYRPRFVMTITEALVINRYSPNRDLQTPLLSQIPELLDLKSEISCDMLSQGAMFAAQVICVSSARQWIVTGRILSLP